MLEHKSGNISEIHRDRGKVTMEGLQEINNALLNGTISDPLRPSLPQDWGSQPLPQTPIVVISGTDEATNFKFGRNIHRIHPNNSPFKILVKRERGHIQGLPNFWDNSNYLDHGSLKKLFLNDVMMMTYLK